MIDEKVTSKFHSAGSSSVDFSDLLVKKSKMNRIWVFCY